MADIFSKEKRSEIMSKVRSKETKLEAVFRRELWRSGFRYRKNAVKWFGKPDILMKKYKTVVFIDSCFWHGCKKHFKLPSTKPDFWRMKIERNKRRDREVTRHYKKENWNVVRVWEHELSTNAKKEAALEKIKRFLLNR